MNKDIEKIIHDIEALADALRILHLDVLAQKAEGVSVELQRIQVGV